MLLKNNAAQRYLTGLTATCCTCWLIILRALTVSSTDDCPSQSKTSCTVSSCGLVKGCRLRICRRLMKSGEWIGKDTSCAISATADTLHCSSTVTAHIWEFGAITYCFRSKRYLYLRKCGDYFV